MPPVAAHVDGAGNGASADARIGSRLAALFSSAAAPAGSFNTTLGVKARPGVVRVDGDLATIDFVVPRGDWGIAGSAAIRAFIQQLVYTATEESGIRRVLITENGQRAVIGGEGIALYRPAFGATVRAGDAISGAIRAFEARFEYRITDAKGVTLTDQFATATLGTAERVFSSFEVSR